MTNAMRTNAVQTNAVQADICFVQKDCVQKWLCAEIVVCREVICRKIVRRKVVCRKDVCREVVCSNGREPKGCVQKQMLCKEQANICCAEMVFVQEWSYEICCTQRAKRKNREDESKNLEGGRGRVCLFRVWWSAL